MYLLCIYLYLANKVLLLRLQNTAVVVLLILPTTTRSTSLVHSAVT